MNDDTPIGNDKPVEEKKFIIVPYFKITKEWIAELDEKIYNILKDKPDQPNARSTRHR